MQNLQKSAATLARECQILTALQPLIGTTYSAPSKEAIADLSGFATDDIIGPDEGGVMRYQIYVDVDCNCIITGFSFTQ